MTQGSTSTAVKVAISLGLLAVVVAAIWVLSPDRAESGPGFVGGPSGKAVVWAVGDAADGEATSEEVADLIEGGDPDRFIYLGDVYEDGTAEEFDRNYEPTLGSLREITLPTPGNHEWPNHTEGYDPYWGEVLGQARPPEFYSVDVAGWELISLNSEGDVDAESEQYSWLRGRVAGGGDCRIAFFHRPRFSAGEKGDADDLAPLWDLLAGRSRLALSGHDHNMQRLDPVDGIVPLIAGAGGRSQYDLDESDPRLAFGDAEEYGALRLTLRPGRASWEFVSTDGDVLDRGERTCEDDYSGA